MKDGYVVHHIRKLFQAGWALVQALVWICRHRYVNLSLSLSLSLSLCVSLSLSVSCFLQWLWWRFRTFKLDCGLFYSSALKLGFLHELFSQLFLYLFLHLFSLAVCTLTQNGMKCIRYVIWMFMFMLQMLMEGSQGQMQSSSSPCHSFRGQTLSRFVYGKVFLFLGMPKLFWNSFVVYSDACPLLLSTI